MREFDIIAIEQRARRLRAEEMQRVHGLVGERMGLYGRLLAASLLDGLIFLGDSLFLLFSWNPDDAVRQRPTHHVRVSLLTRANRFARRLFSWNPQPHRS